MVPAATRNNRASSALSSSHSAMNGAAANKAIPPKANGTVRQMKQVATIWRFLSSAAS